MFTIWVEWNARKRELDRFFLRNIPRIFSSKVVYIPWNYGTRKRFTGRSEIIALFKVVLLVQEIRLELFTSRFYFLTAPQLSSPRIQNIMIVLKGRWPPNRLNSIHKVQTQWLPKPTDWRKCVFWTKSYRPVSTSLGEYLIKKCYILGDKKARAATIHRILIPVFRLAFRFLSYGRLISPGL